MDNETPHSNTPVRPPVLQAIGGTPLVALSRIPPADCATILVKLEYYNPTGSYKDRMALAMVEGAERRGELRPGMRPPMRVVEFTGGSTGSSLALVCAVKGYPLEIVTSDAFAREKLRTMQALGARLTIIPSVGGKVTPDLTPRMVERAREMAQEPGVYFTNQLRNPDVVRGYEPMGEEILRQVAGSIDAFCGGVGTAGMLMGVARALRRAGSRAKIVALEPASSPILSRGTVGTHGVEGIGIGMVPPLLDKEFYDEARGIEEVEAREMARRLAREEGIFAGTSSGLNVAGALELGRELGPGHTVVTVAVDTGLKYLAGDLFEGE